jgi:hypothetical protein
MNTIYLKPSFYSHITNGVLLFIAFIILYKSYSKIIYLEPYKVISLILLLSISVGIHSLSHLGLEKCYGYNPISIIYA